MALSSAARKDLFFFSRQGEPSCNSERSIRLFLVFISSYIFFI